MAEPLPLMLRPMSEDQHTTMERRWRAPIAPAKPQRPCDTGLFGDTHLQADIVDALQRMHGDR